MIGSLKGYGILHSIFLIHAGTTSGSRLFCVFCRLCSFNPFCAHLHISASLSRRKLPVSRAYFCYTFSQYSVFFSSAHIFHFSRCLVASLCDSLGPAILRFYSIYPKWKKFLPEAFGGKQIRLWN